MTGFTKGDWWASGARVYAHSENPLDADDPLLVAHVDESVADCDMDMRIDHDTEATANARLIAAAPDLYEALIQCVDRFERITRWMEKNAPINFGACAFDAAEDMARAALAKATGAP